MLTILSNPSAFIGQTFPANGSTVRVINYFPKADRYLVESLTGYRYAMYGCIVRLTILDVMPVQPKPYDAGTCGGIKFKRAIRRYSPVFA